MYPSAFPIKGIYDKIWIIKNYSFCLKHIFEIKIGVDNVKHYYIEIIIYPVNDK